MFMDGIVSSVCTVNRSFARPDQNELCDSFHMPYARELIFIIPPLAMSYFTVIRSVIQVYTKPNLGEFVTSHSLRMLYFVMLPFSDYMLPISVRILYAILAYCRKHILGFRSSIMNRSVCYKHTGN